MVQCLRQLSALLWKCWLLRKRHKITTFFEIVFPLLSCLFVLLIIRKSSMTFNVVKKPAEIYNESFSNKFNLKNSRQPIRNERQIELEDDFEFVPNRFESNYPIEGPLVFARDDDGSTNSEPEDTTTDGGDIPDFNDYDNKKMDKFENKIVNFDEIYIWPDNHFPRKMVEMMKKKFQFFSFGFYGMMQKVEFLFNGVFKFINELK